MKTRGDGELVACEDVREDGEGDEADVHCQCEGMVARRTGRRMLGRGMRKVPNGISLYDDVEGRLSPLLVLLSSSLISSPSGFIGIY